MAVEKISVSLPSALLKEARKHAGENGLSRMLTEGLKYEIQIRRQRGLVREMNEQFGPVSQEDLDEAARWLDE